MRRRALTLALAGLWLTPGVTRGAPADVGTDACADPALARVKELLTSGSGELKAPESPRFTSLREPSLRGTRVVLGWLLPLSSAQGPEAATLAAALGGVGDARSSVSLPPAGKVTSSVAIEDVAGRPILVVAVSSPRRGVSKELELAVLGAVARLSDDASAPLSGLARRALSPLSRVVVEVHPPELPRVGVRLSKPERHVIELRLDAGPPRPKLYVAKPGDTLAKVAKQFGVSEKALLDVNRIEVGRLSPGQKLVLPR